MVQDPIHRYWESDDRRVEWSVRSGGEAAKTYKSWGKRRRGGIIACTLQTTSARAQLCSPDGMYARKYLVDGGLLLLKFDNTVSSPMLGACGRR